MDMYIYICILWTSHPVIAAIRDHNQYIRVLQYSYYITITGWGFLFRYIYIYIYIYIHTESRNRSCYGPHMQWWMPEILPHPVCTQYFAVQCCNSSEPSKISSRRSGGLRKLVGDGENWATMRNGLCGISTRRASRLSPRVPRTGFPSRRSFAEDASGVHRSLLGLGGARLGRSEYTCCEVHMCKNPTSLPSTAGE